MTPKKITRAARMMRKHDTWAEKLMWTWLRDRRFSAYKFRRQHAFGPYILDFFCIEARLDIELDGFGHGLPKKLAADAERDTYLEERGIRVMRFWNSRLRREKQFVRDSIWSALQQRAPHPLPNYCRPICAHTQDSNSQKKLPAILPLPKGEGRGEGERNILKPTVSTLS